MPVEHLRHDDSLPYYIMPWATAQDDRLGLPELGLLAWLLSLPPDWEIRHAQVAKRYGIGRQRVRALLSVLEQAGYVSREAVKSDKGAVERWIVTVHPLSTDPPLRTVKGGTSQTTPLVQNPLGGFRTTEREHNSTEKIDTYRRASENRKPPTSGRPVPRDTATPVDDPKQALAAAREALKAPWCLRCGGYRNTTIADDGARVCVGCGAVRATKGS